jgi:hypothetical protein
MSSKLSIHKYKISVEVSRNSTEYSSVNLTYIEFGMALNVGFILTSLYFMSNARHPKTG